MIADRIFRYDSRERPTAVRTGRAPILPDYFNERDNIFEMLSGSNSDPADWAHDFLVIARSVYLADKLSDRKGMADKWTRNIDLSIQVREPDRWLSHRDALNRLLALIASDRWTIDFVGGWRKQRQEPLLEVSSRRTVEVALFSGGLDSTAYAASAARSAGGPLLLVSHFHNDKWIQDRVFPYITRSAERRVDPVSFRQLPRVPVRLRNAFKLANEYTTRSRAFLFIAAAVYAAAARGVSRVAVPENGQLAVNPPLAPNRVAACGTRSVHPLSLHLINQIIREVGGDVTVYNPLRHRTKGEICKLLVEADFGAEALVATVSCSKALASQIRRGDHCGCCWPCLVRRSGLAAAVRDGDPTHYDDDPWDPRFETGKRWAQKRSDLMALLFWLHKPFGVRDLAADLPLPPDTSPSELLAPIERGREELRQMLDRNLPSNSSYRRLL